MKKQSIHTLEHYFNFRQITASLPNKIIVIFTVGIKRIIDSHLSHIHLSSVVTRIVRHKSALGLTEM